MARMLQALKNLEARTPRPGAGAGQKPKSTRPAPSPIPPPEPVLPADGPVESLHALVSGLANLEIHDAPLPSFEQGKPVFAFSQPPLVPAISLVDSASPVPSPASPPTDI